MMEPAEEPKTAAVSIRLSKQQEQFLRDRASQKGVGLSDYLRSLIARALQAELAEEKTGTDAFIDSLL